ncbi:MAG: sigma-E processing peptidase SpoIIGA, partial [Bacillota bacterium]
MKGLRHMEEVYLDLIFAVNFVMDYLLLLVTGISLGLTYSHFRLSLGAFIGALYATVILLPPLAFLDIIALKLAFSLVIIVLAFGWGSFKAFIKVLTTFYLVTFLVGGGIIGCIFMLRNSNFLSLYNGSLLLMHLPLLWLLPGIIILFFIGYFGVALYKQHRLRARYAVDVEVNFADKHICTKALIDTGNNLREPFTGRPVLIMEASLFRDILPMSTKCWAKKEVVDGLGLFVDKLRGTTWENRVRLLPYYSLGTQQGL